HQASGYRFFLPLTTHRSLFLVGRGEGEQLVIGSDEDAAVDGNRRLEAPYQAHLFVRPAAREDQLAGFAVVGVQPIARFRARRPPDRFRRTVRRGHDRRAAAEVADGPGQGERRRVGGADLYADERLVVGAENDIGAAGGRE